MTADETLLE